MSSKKSLIEIVQDCLAAMESDRVDTINDTEESVLVAGYVRDAYFELIERLTASCKVDWLHGPIGIGSSADPANPTLVELAQPVRRITYLGYNVANAGDPPNFRELRWQDHRCFLAGRGTANGERMLTTPAPGFSVYITTDRMPANYTTLDDTHLLLDCVDLNVEVAVQSSRFQALGYREPEFLMENDFIPDLPANLFPLYLAECRQACFSYLKQTSSPVDAARSFRQMAQARRDKASRIVPNTPYFNLNYGRRR